MACQPKLALDGSASERSLVGRYRTRTYDLVRVKQRRSQTTVDLWGIAEEIGTWVDSAGPTTTQNRHQSATRMTL
jgi:hypothetical protein